jgi:predicted rRNA methylase YqxC with S4 and FtsJ domains
MKLFLKIFFAFFCLVQAIESKAQIATEPRTEEYATVRIVISAITGNISTTTTLSNPYLEMEAGAMELKNVLIDPKGTKFENITEIINYMNKFGWSILAVNTVEILGSKNSEFLLYYTFKRKPKK